MHRRTLNYPPTRLSSLHRRPLGLLVVGMLAIAGCLGAPSSETAADRASTDAGVNDVTGGLQGTVTDESLAPLELATVVLDGETTSQTDARGSFSFSYVDPGTHAVAVVMDGYSDVVRQVDVVAGEVATVSVSLSALASVEAYHETVARVGMVGCSVAWFIVQDTGTFVTYFLLPPCEVATILVGPTVPTAYTVDRSRNYFHVGPLQDVAGFWAETEWTASQALGNGMWISWTYPMDPERISAYPFVPAVFGTSPVRRAAPIQLLLDNITANPSPLCTVDDCTVDSIHRNSPEFSILGEPTPVRIGVMLQQRFTDYLTVFHRGEFPLEFTALADA